MIVSGPVGNPESSWVYKRSPKTINLSPKYKLQKVFKISQDVLSWYLQDSIGGIFYEDSESGHFNSLNKNIEFTVFDEDW